MQEKSSKFKFLIPILSGLLAVIFVLSGAIYIIFNINIFNESKIQIIKAPKGPIKEKPVDAGGKIIDHLDADFYGILDKDIEAQVVEVIKPPDPEPELPTVKLGININEPIDNISVISNTGDKNDSSLLMTEDNVTSDNKSFSENNILLNDNVTGINMDKIAQTNEFSINDNITEIIDTPVSKPKKGYFIQLASFNEEAKAKLSAEILNEKLAVSLNGNSLNVMKVDLGKGKGIWWRIVTDILNRNDAETICALLKSEGNNCIVRSK